MPVVAFVPGPAEARTVNTYAVSQVPFQMLALDGGATTLNLGDNSLTALFSMGLQTTFFGESTNVFWVSSNGFITLINPHDPGNGAGPSLPTTASTGFMAGFWTDLDPSQGGSVQFENLPAPPGSNATRVLVVQYANVPLHNSGTTNTFQIQVFDNGNYEVHWAGVSSDALDATIGGQNEAGDVAFTSAHGPLSRANDAVRFTPTTEDVPDPAPAPYTLQQVTFRPLTLDANAGVLNADPADDQMFGPIQFGFSAPFFNSSVSAARISSNGFLTFDTNETNAGCCNGQELPDANAPNAVIAPFWTDLFAPGGAIRVETLGAPPGTNASLVFVVDYNGVGVCCNASNTTMSFQIQFYDNGLIELMYGHVQGDAHNATVGIEDASGASAVLVARGPGLSADSLGIALVPAGLTPPPPPPTSLPSFSPHTGFPNTVITITNVSPGTSSNVLFTHVASQVSTIMAGNFVSPGTIQVQPPGQLPTGALQIRLLDGNSNVVFDFGSDTFDLQGQTSPPPPNGTNSTPLRVTSITPDHGPGGTHVLIAGQGFAPGATVRIGGISVPTTVDDAELLEATVPSNAPIGLSAVIVIGPDGRKDALDGGFQVEPLSPVVTLVSPDHVHLGQSFRVIGANFAPGVRVFVGGQEASVFQTTPTQISAFTFASLEGPVPVHVVNPDARSAFVPDALTIVRGPEVTRVTPSLAQPGTLVGIDGFGFGSGSAVLVDGQPQDVVLDSFNFVQFRLSDEIRPGVHDLRVFSEGRSTLVEQALVVEWPANIALGPLTITKGELQTDQGSVPANAVLGQTATVTVTNDGGATAPFTVVSFTATPATDSFDPLGFGAGASQRFANVVVRDLRPGQSVSVSAHWDTSGRIGDHVIQASASPAFHEPRFDDNNASARTFVLVGGIRGMDACDPSIRFFGGCPPVVQPPTAPVHVTERRTVHETNTSAADLHFGATTQLSFLMPRTFATRFDFTNPTSILTSSQNLPGGGFRSCTVWRFASPQGTIGAFLDPDAIDGELVVAAKAFSLSNGSTQDHTREQYYLLPDTKPIQTRDEDTGTSAHASQPRASYAFPNASFVHVEGSSVRGDFSQCIDSDAGGNTTELLTFAALPNDLSDPVPSFAGFGTIGTLRVEYQANETTTTSEFDSPPSDRDLTQGVTG